MIAGAAAKSEENGSRYHLARALAQVLRQTEGSTAALFCFGGMVVETASSSSSSTLLARGPGRSSPCSVPAKKDSLFVFCEWCEKKAWMSGCCLIIVRM